MDGRKQILHQYATLHFTIFLFNTIDYMILLCIALHYIHFVALHCTSANPPCGHPYATLHFIKLHQVHYTTLHATTLHCTSLNWTIPNSANELQISKAKRPSKMLLGKKECFALHGQIWSVISHCSTVEASALLKYPLFLIVPLPPFSSVVACFVWLTSPCLLCRVRTRLQINNNNYFEWQMLDDQILWLAQIDFLDMFWRGCNTINS